MLDGEVPRRLLNHTGKEGETERQKQRGRGAWVRGIGSVKPFLKTLNIELPHGPIIHYKVQTTIIKTMFHPNLYADSNVILFIVGRATPLSSCSWMDIYMVFICNVVHITIGFFTLHFILYRTFI